MEEDMDSELELELEMEMEEDDEPLHTRRMETIVLFEPRPEAPERRKAEVWSYRPDFSNVSISGLSERLFGEEESNTKKLVYLCVERSSTMSWMAFNAHEPSVCGVDDALASPNSSLLSQLCNAHEASVCGVVDDALTSPNSSLLSQLCDLGCYGCAVRDLTKITIASQLRVLTCYGCAVSDSSKIIIAGGKCREVPSNKVFIYDTLAKTWEPSFRQMNRARGEKPTVVAINTKIYVFGGGPDIATQSEFTYSSTSWGYLPQCHADLISPGAKIISHAVYPKGNQILFCQDPFAVSSFNYRSGRWERYDMSGTVGVGLQWSAAVVVFEDILFWHHRGTVFAHDLLNHVTIPTYTLPRTGLSSALFSADDVPPPSFLVHIGKGKLCLLYWVKNRIRFITYTVQISQGVGAPIPHTVLSHSGFLETTPVSGIMHALEASY